jgi:hypothetical protein
MEKTKLPQYLQSRMDQNYQESRRSHTDNLSVNSLKSRIREQNRIQAEKNRLYDLENPISEEDVFKWED